MSSFLVTVANVLKTGLMSQHDLILESLCDATWAEVNSVRLVGHAGQKAMVVAW